MLLRLCARVPHVSMVLLCVAFYCVYGVACVGPSCLVLLVVHDLLLNVSIVLLACVLLRSCVLSYVVVWCMCVCVFAHVVCKVKLYLKHVLHGCVNL